MWCVEVRKLEGSVETASRILGFTDRATHAIHASGVMMIVCLGFVDQSRGSRVMADNRCGVEGVRVEASFVVERQTAV